MPFGEFETVRTFLALPALGQSSTCYGAPLRCRGLECLPWSAEGKKAEGVGAVLGPSVSTVNHPMSAAAGKMGRLNKHHAVVLALRASLI